MKIAILGINGMLGTAVMRRFQDAGIPFTGFARPEFDATRPDAAKLRGYDYIINCIGVIKPYIHDNNSDEVSRAIKINAEFPHWLSNLDARIIQIATDCVWDGVRGAYTETDAHNATDVYGKTKSLGEVAADNFLNLRCSIIGREKKSFLSLLEWFLNQPANAKLNGFRNHLWNGVTTDAFADICAGIITNDAWFAGMQHVVPADTVSKADMLHTFADRFGRGDIEITDMDAATPVNRTIATNNPARNSAIWHAAGYSQIPRVTEMIYNIRGI
ncbi:sugar nucleotide-binding protein [bacterium]|nr:sugar nucleotide-binding protein [bacterium]